LVLPLSSLRTADSPFNNHFDGLIGRVWCAVPRFAARIVDYQPEDGLMTVLRILLLVMSAGVLAYLLYEAITRQIPRDTFWSVIVIACALSLNLIYLWFSTTGGPPIASIEDKPPVAVEEKAPRAVDKANDAGPVAMEDKSSAAAEEKAPAVDKANDARPRPDESSGKQGLTPNCEKELRRTADLLRFFANRTLAGEEIRSVVADVKQQEKRIAAVCPELRDK
jgi:hypothetical protein